MVAIATELRAGAGFTIQPFTSELFTRKVILWLLVSTLRALTCWWDDGCGQGGIASLSGYFEHFRISKPACCPEGAQAWFGHQMAHLGDAASAVCWGSNFSRTRRQNHGSIMLNDVPFPFQHVASSSGPSQGIWELLCCIMV